MKSLKLATVISLFSTLLINQYPAIAGRLFSLKHNIGFSRNDGNPRLLISDGSRMVVICSPINSNPFPGNSYGFGKMWRLNQSDLNGMASMLHDGRNSVDVIDPSGSSGMNSTYEKAMYQSCDRYPGR
jgi:hypothetical protein